MNFEWHIPVSGSGYGIVGLLHAIPTREFENLTKNKTQNTKQGYISNNCSERKQVKANNFRTMNKFPPPPPFLDLSRTRTDGLAFIGLSLSSSRQSCYNFNDIQDREYQFIASTNDDGFLCGGGEKEDSFKLPAEDSAHVEIMRIGCFDTSLGGLDFTLLDKKMRDGSVLIPVMEVVPTAVVCNGDFPPELEVRFDLEIDTTGTTHCFNFANWQLEFLHNNLFDAFQFAARFCPGPYHSTFARKVTFRNEETKELYFEQVSKVVTKWRTLGPQVLKPKNTSETVQPPQDNYSGNGCCVSSPGGVYLFKHRAEIYDYYPPNFLPPYDTPEKIAIIESVLKKRWNANIRAFEENSDMALRSVIRRI